MERKKPENVVPPPYNKLFASFDYFNEMQNALLDDLLYTDKSMVLSAPTGSGKTVAFELAIVRMLQNTTQSHRDGITCDKILPKAIYIAPIKALCSEKFTDWKPRFESVGVTCSQLTGDTEASNLNAIRKAQVVISTPEKWDSLTRRWRDFEKLLPAVQLFIVDEVHLLSEDMRGPVLEAVIARMKSSGVKRFIVASATIPNAEDLTSWIRSGTDAGRIQVVQHLFNDMQRPVPLEKHVIGFNSKKRGFLFDMHLNFQLPDILRKYAESKASLVFCSSRKSAEMAALNLNKSTSVFSLSENQKSYLSQIAPSILDVKLRKLIENGIAYHHAGLHYADRGLIETCFRQGFLMVLISTSTLAMGINLPARLVVIKSTETYACGGFKEYPESMILQMIGRAGRPQYDTKGVAVILTQQKNVLKYQKLLNGTTPIESHLHKYLTEHLNSEIALNTITSLEMAMVWMRSTYLYVRAVRNPKHYGFDAKLTKDFVEQKLEELCLRQINALKSAGLVLFDPLTGIDVKSTVHGQLMSKYYLCFETMKLFRQLSGRETLEDLLKLLVQCKEMSEFTLRVNEKKILNTLNKSPIRFPIKGRIKNSEEKISCIIQAVLGCIEISAPGLIQESLKIMRIGNRVSKSLLEHVRLRVNETATDNDDTPSNWYSAILSAVRMAKCLHVKLWENSEFASKQLHGIGAVYSNAFAKVGLTNLKSIAKTEARTIERLLNKSAPFGDEVLGHLMTFPDYELKLVRQSKCFIQVQVKQLSERFVSEGSDSAVLIIGDSLNNLLLMEENLNKIIYEYGSFERLVKIQQTNEVDYIYGHVVHVSMVGVDAYDALEINAPKVAAKNKNVGISNTKKPKTKQSRLNFSLDDSFFNKTGFSDDSLNLDDVLGNSFEHFHHERKTAATSTNNDFRQDDSVAKHKDAEATSVLDGGNKTTNKVNFSANSTTTDLENFRFKKLKMKQPIDNLTIGKNTLDNILADDTLNNKTLNATTLTNVLSTTSKQKREKQRKLTDFFGKQKKVEQQRQKTFKSFDLNTSTDSTQMKAPEITSKSTTSSLENQFVTPPKELQRSNLTDQQNTPLSSRKRQLRPFNITKNELVAKNNDRNETSGDNIFDNSKENSKEFTYSSSDDLKLTIIPNNNKKVTYSNSFFNDSFASVDVVNAVKPKNFDNASKGSPLTLSSFLVDADLHDISGPIIKLPEETAQKTKTHGSLLQENSNKSKRKLPTQKHSHSVSMKENFFKPKNTNTPLRNNTPDSDDAQLERITKTLRSHFEESLSKCHYEKRAKVASLDFERPDFSFFDLPPCSNFGKIATPDTPNFFFESLESTKKEQISPFATKKDADHDSFASNWKPNLAEIKVTAKYEPKNKRKYFNDSFASTTSFEKFCRDESLLQTNFSESPKTQDSPLDLSKAAILKKKAKLQTTNIRNESKATQTDETHTKLNENDLKLWHKVALQFRKFPKAQAQSLENFQLAYNAVRQKQQQQQHSTSSATLNYNPIANTSKGTNNTTTRNLLSSHIGDNKRNQSSFKVKQQSTFRLQLFDAEEQYSKDCQILKPREIKLINQNVMNLVLQKKCAENSRLVERPTNDKNVLEELEKDLGLHDVHIDDWDHKSFF